MKCVFHENFLKVHLSVLESSKRKVGVENVKKLHTQGLHVN